MKILGLSMLTIAISGVIGCGGEDSTVPETRNDAVIYRVQVANDYLQDALVWLDLNSNYQLDSDEPQAYTDVNGIALLDVSELETEPSEYSLIALANKNQTIVKSSGEKVDKSYLMVAPAGMQTITPIAHVIHSKQKASAINVELATEAIAALIENVNIQELISYLSHPRNLELHALSRSILPALPEDQSSLSEQHIIQAHPALESAIADFNSKVEPNINNKSNTTENISTDSSIGNAGSDAKPDSSAPVIDSGHGDKKSTVKTQAGSATSNSKMLQPSIELTKLTQRVTQKFILEEKIAAQSRSKTVNGLANYYGSILQVDGRWQDIDYDSVNDSKLPSEEHLKRVETIAAAFRITTDLSYKSDAIKALGFWLREKPIVTQWWEEVGQYHSLAKIALLLAEDLSPSLKQKITDDFPHQFGIHHVGLNRIDIALVNVYYGLLVPNEHLIRDGISNIEQVIEDMYVNGMSLDWSPVLTQTLNSGKTGEDQFYTILNWADNVKDLPWGMTELSLEILASILLDGVRWMESFDQLSLDKPSELQLTVEDGEITPMKMIAELYPVRQDEARAYQAHVYESALSGLNGFKHFWRTGSTVAATKDFMFGIRMDSVDTLSQANNSMASYLKFWLGLGSTSLIQSGKEYQTPYPAFDVTKIPGLTVPQYSKLPAYDAETLQNIEFYGGATDGQVGVTTMLFSMNAYRLEGDALASQQSTTVRDTLDAKKSWFSFGDKIVALGSGIKSSHSEAIYTTINQTVLKGPVTLSNLDNLVFGDFDASNYSWVHHDGVGYVFLDNSPRRVLLSKHTGTTDDGTPFEQNLFTLTMSHGVKPATPQSYKYIILPNKNAEQTASFQQRMPIRELANDKDVQAVEHIDKKIVAAVFFVPSQLTISPELSLKVDSPCVVILDRSGLSLRITISTPGKAYRGVNITIEENGQIKTQRVVTPGNNDTGKSITFEFEPYQSRFPVDDTYAFQGYMTHLPVEDFFVQGGSHHTDTKYGRLGYMQLKNGVYANDRKSLVRYDLSLVELKDLNRATLRLFVRGIRNDGTLKRSIVARLVHTSKWNEINTTYSTYPLVTMVKESPPTYLGNEAQGQWIDIDVTDLVLTVQPEQKHNLVFELADLTQDYYLDYVSFATREFGYKGPQLILE